MMKHWEKNFGCSFLKHRREEKIEEEKKTRMAIAKLFALHANTKMISYYTEKLPVLKKHYYHLTRSIFPNFLRKEGKSIPKIS